MANGHVEIHDPFTNNNLASSGTDPTSQTTDMDTTIEFRLLMVYNQRRHPRRVPEVEGQGQAEPPSPKTSEIDMEVKLRGKEEKKKKRKRRGMKGVFGMCSCMRPQIKTGLSDSEEPNFRSGSFTVDVPNEEEDDLDKAAGKLTEIADDIPFTPPDIETDSPDDVEKVIGLLLREAGDKLNEETEGANIAAELLRNYSFFEKVMQTLQKRMGLISSEPDHVGPQASPKAQIAVTFEATSRLLTLTSVPQRRMLGYGARYLQEYYSSWVTQNGGYLDVFHSDDEEDVE